jgi:hypothetical protein
VYLSGGMKIPFPGAAVRLIDATLPSEDPKVLVAEVTTNENGNFVFSQVKPGLYTLLIRGILSELPPDLAECPNGISFDDWWIYSEITPEGHVDISATLTTEINVSSLDVVRYVINLSCG